MSNNLLEATQYKQIRIQQLKQQNINPYPHKFETNISISEFREKYNYLEPDQQLSNSPENIVLLAGRVIFKREFSKKLLFYQITGNFSKIQVMANYKFYGDPQNWDKITEIIHRGDIIGITGIPARSKTKELSIIPLNIILLAPCLHMLPHPDNLKDQELRYRSRYLDLIINGNIYKIFSIRRDTIKFIRQFLDNKGFIEVETPTMNLLPGGAAAKPFVTYHHELSQNLFLRVAPELYLKQLVIGGLEKVYEIGKNYRNEGMDLTHNPEFSAIEFYQAYCDYTDLLNITEDLLSKLIFAIHGSYKINYHLDGNPIILDFTPPFRRIDIIPYLENRLNIIFPQDLELDFLKNILVKYNIDCKPPLTITRILDKLIGIFIEPGCISPTFLINHPQIMSPLAKWHRDKPGISERFELFVAGRELCNAYTELNDPIKQRELFESQAKERELGNEEAQLIDENFCTAMEYGLPPTGGFGMGIDRLVMLLADKINIKEVILFPCMGSLEKNI